MTNRPDQQSRTILLVGASRGLGQAMATEFVKKGWQVVGTVREGRRAELDGLGPVENQRELIIAAPRWTIAAKLVSVLSLRMATRLNSLSLQKKFSIKCRHL